MILWLLWDYLMSVVCIVRLILVCLGLICFLGGFFLFSPSWYFGLIFFVRLLSSFYWVFYWVLLSIGFLVCYFWFVGFLGLLWVFCWVGVFCLIVGVYFRFYFWFIFFWVGVGIQLLVNNRFFLFEGFCLWVGAVCLADAELLGLVDALVDTLVDDIVLTFFELRYF